MTTEPQIRLAFHLIEEAILGGVECPLDVPRGPIPRDCISALIDEGRIKSEVYHGNLRVVTVLIGPLAGRSTKNSTPIRVNGVSVR